jgi:hypothetical protein
MMKIFPCDGYSYDGPAVFSESQYSYLSRSNRPEMQKERDLLQSWFDNYPEGEKKEILSRIQSHNDWQFDSVFYEMFLHAVLTRLGCMVEVHPSTKSDDDRTPDFLVTTSNGQQFYLEARVGNDRSEKEASRERLTAALLDLVRGFPSPNFFINVNIINFPSEPVPQNPVRQFIEALIADVDPDELEKQILNSDKGKNLDWPIFENRGAKIEFSLIPKHGSKGITGGSSLGMTMFPLRTVDSSARILNVLKKKAGKYKKLNLPYVIALNASMWGLTSEELNETLFGQGSLFLGNSSYEAIQQGFHKRRHTRVSSIWFSKRLSLDSLCSAQVCQYDNPWASKPLKTLFSGFGHVRLIGMGKTDKNEGQSLRPLLDLSEGWPE